MNGSPDSKGNFREHAQIVEVLTGMCHAEQRKANAKNNAVQHSKNRKSKSTYKPFGAITFRRAEIENTENLSNN